MPIALKAGKHTAAKTTSRARRQMRGRKKLQGSAERPRLVVTRSSRHVFAQVVDDLEGRTVASASTMEADIRALDGDKSARARRVGELGVGLTQGFDCRAAVDQKPGPDRLPRATLKVEAPNFKTYLQTDLSVSPVAGGSWITVLLRLLLMLRPRRFRCRAAR